jgi:hypothetical protein
LIKIIDNFFEDPDSIRKFALPLEYYTKTNHPQLKKDPKGIGAFPGYRTAFFDDIGSKFYNDIHNKILPHVCKLENIKKPSEKYTNFNLQISFSYTFKGANSFRHIDKISPGYKVRYGGLVYLYPKPPKKCGTTLYLKDTTYLENKYNRFVIYNSNIEHEPTDNFGTDINNSRLVLTIFYDMA